MKNIIFYLTTISIALSFNSCKENKNVEENSYLEINAQATGYTDEAGTLNIMGYFVAPQFQGTINKEGKIKLELPSNFNEISLKAFNDYNRVADSGYELSPIGIEDLVTSLENLELKEENVQLALAGKYYGFEVFTNDVKTGRVFPASSKDFMLHIINPEKNDIETGYYYMMVYSTGELNLTGKNKSPIAVDDEGNYTLFSHTSYDIHLNKGWNAIKYEITSLVNDDNNVSQIDQSAFSSVKMQELDFNWVYFSL